MFSLHFRTYPILSSQNCPSENTARSTYNDGQFEVRLVASKTRVAPIKRQTIPHLKLLGALILAHLTNKLKSLGTEIPIVLWTDSMTTLCWIKNKQIWKQYVGQRVDKIHHLTAKESWRHCPGEVNPQIFIRGV